MLKILSNIGRPQIYALLLLLAFMGQCFWLISKTSSVSVGIDLAPMSNSGSMLHPNVHGKAVQSSPIVTEVVAVASAIVPASMRNSNTFWVQRTPFVFFAALLGASLWYVSRRLYGNAGGYIALALYCFSPAVISRSSTIHADTIAAWGTFGCIFTGIAVAHTLYAPREVVLWNWRRILLLGVALGLGVAAQVSVAFSVPIALALMLYLVPERRGAALAIMGAACAVALVVLLASYSFQPSALMAAVRLSNVQGFSPQALGEKVTYMLLGLFFLRNSPGVVFLLLSSLVVYVAWRRSRFFGNTAPLLVSAIFILMGVIMPLSAGFSFLLLALPFVFVFIAGICSDLLETRYRNLVVGIVLGVLISHALFSLGGLHRLARNVSSTHLK